jgi:hypothetical protein
VPLVVGKRDDSSAEKVVSTGQTVVAKGDVFISVRGHQFSEWEDWLNEIHVVEVGIELKQFYYNKYKITREN